MSVRREQRAEAEVSVRVIFFIHTIKITNQTEHEASCNEATCLESHKEKQVWCVPYSLRDPKSVSTLWETLGFLQQAS